jgi:hypothetical protein
VCPLAPQKGSKSRILHFRIYCPRVVLGSRGQPRQTRWRQVIARAHEGASGNRARGSGAQPPPLCPRRRSHQPTPTASIAVCVQIDVPLLMRNSCSPRPLVLIRSGLSREMFPWRSATFRSFATSHRGNCDRHLLPVGNCGRRLSHIRDSGRLARRFTISIRLHLAGVVYGGPLGCGGLSSSALSATSADHSTSATAPFRGFGWLQ